MLLAVAYAVLTVCAVVILSGFRRNRRHLPPGPKPLPSIGNLHQLPKADRVKVYRDWSTIYGTLVVASHRLDSVLTACSAQAAM